jgi:hypothetical protein
VRQAQITAEQRAAGVTARVDLAGKRFAGFTTGTAAMTTLVVFDAIPLNCAAQASGLGAAPTWLITGIMLAASAMADLELTRVDSRRRGTLLILMTAGLAALTVLRTMFLVTVADESWPRRSCRPSYSVRSRLAWWSAARRSWRRPGR